MFPSTLAWQRLDEPGLEEVRLARGADLAFQASGSLLHPGGPVNLSYRMDIGPAGLVERAKFAVHVPDARRLVLTRSADGGWLADGLALPGLDDCIDLDLECCGLTNALPICRLALAPGDSAQLNVLFVRIPGLACVACPQTYTWLDDADGHMRYRYQSPGFEAVLDVDEHGFTHRYGGFLARLAMR